MKTILTLLFLFLTVPVLAQENPCESDEYLRYRDIPNAKLNSANRIHKRKAEKKCHVYRQESQGNWGLAKSVLITNEASPLYLEGEIRGIEEGRTTTGGFGKGFLVGVVVTGLSLTLAFKTETGIPFYVSPLSSVLVSGLLAKPNTLIPIESIDIYDNRPPEFLAGYNAGYSKGSTSKNRASAIGGSVLGSLTVGAATLGFFFWVILQTF